MVQSRAVVAARRAAEVDVTDTESAGSQCSDCIFETMEELMGLDDGCDY